MRLRTTNLDFILRSKGVTTVALGGFLTNCCVELTMRTAYEKGYEVVTSGLDRGAQRRGAGGGGREELSDVLEADDPWLVFVEPQGRSDGRGLFARLRGRQKERPPPQAAS